MEQVVPLHRRLSAIGETELYDPVVAAELHYFLQELRPKLLPSP